TIHLALVLAMAAVPDRWSQARMEAPRSVMTISLGGAEGPSSGGVNPLAARPVQRAVPEAPRGRPEALRPPAARTPAMTIPVPDPKLKARPTKEKPPAPEVKQAPEGARGTTPTTGPEERFGASVAQTGGYEFGSGLTSGGGGGTGGYLDVGTFCCPDWLITMRRLVQSNWNPRQGVGGSVIIKFVVQRDGRITNVETEYPSGLPALDLTAQRAVLLTRQLPALPAAFSDSALTIHLRFNYSR
ncbi:MAG: energy transducer TonB, partial [Acidobacteria bacterium]